MFYSSFIHSNRTNCSGKAPTDSLADPNYLRECAGHWNYFTKKALAHFTIYHCNQMNPTSPCLFDTYCRRSSDAAIKQVVINDKKNWRYECYFLFIKEGNLILKRKNLFRILQTSSFFSLKKQKTI